MARESMNCKAIVGLLAAYMDKEVTPEEQEQIQAHLTTCQRCREELMALTATRDELRQALRLKAAGVAPPPQAWGGLWQRLEFASRPSFREKLSRLVPRSTIWRAVVTTAVVVILALVGAVWFMGGRGAPPPAPPPPTHPSVIPSSALELMATTERSTYLPGETIEIELTFINVTDKPIIISPFPPEIEIMLPELPEEEDVVKKFAAGSGQVELEWGGEITHTLVWDQCDSSGQQVAPGYYNLNIDVNDIRIDGKGIGGMGACAEVLVQFPQGAMEKTIELDQPQTVNGLTITLERIEMSATTVKFYAFTIPPDYHPPEIQDADISPHELPYLGEMYPVHATYTVDGITKDAGSASLGTRGDGIALAWAHPYVPLDPVPSDAKELIFTISRFGDWEGPWEFHITLE